MPKGIGYGKKGMKKKPAKRGASALCGREEEEAQEAVIAMAKKKASRRSKPKPTDPKKWSAAKAKAKRKFDVYPSAYANGWAVQEYKRMGGGWK